MKNYKTPEIIITEISIADIIQTSGGITTPITTVNGLEGAALGSTTFSVLEG